MAWASAVVDRSMLPALARSSPTGAVYCYFCLYGDADTGENAFPSLRLMGKALGLPVRTIQRAVRTLVRDGLLLVAGDGPNRTKRYTVVRCVKSVAPGASNLSSNQIHKNQIQRNHKSGPPARGVNLASLGSCGKEAPPAPAGEPWTGTDQEAVEALTRAGLLQASRNRQATITRLVRAYRARWPASDPRVWIALAALPALSGSILNRPAWIYRHLAGYARKGWLPTNRDASPRKVHLAALNGRTKEALNLALLEASYAPERHAALHKRPASTERQRRHSQPTALSEILDLAMPA